MMATKPLRIGADRFLALAWANYTFELAASECNLAEAQQLLYDFLAKEIMGSESIRKTANQLSRLWLSSNDGYDFLRVRAYKIISGNNLDLLPILHFGLALNVFPIYKETVEAVGLLSHLSGGALRKTVVNRVGEKFPTISSVPRNVDRVIQTIEDWGFITHLKGIISSLPFPLDDCRISNWLLTAILLTDRRKEYSLVDLTMSPSMLGIAISEPRKAIRASNLMSFHRNEKGSEVIVLNPNTLGTA